MHVANKTWSKQEIGRIAAKEHMRTIHVAQRKAYVRMYPV